MNQSTLDQASKQRHIDSALQQELGLSLEQVASERDSGTAIQNDPIHLIDEHAHTPVKAGRETLAEISKPPVALTAMRAEEKAIALARFISSNAKIDLHNFPKAEKLFKDYFTVNAECKELAFEILAQEIDKRTCKTTQQGKAVISRNPHGLTIERISNKNGSFKQYINLNDEGQLLAFTKWETKARKIELLRSKKYKKNTKLSQMNFDVDLWKTYNQAPIANSSLQKIIDCTERNHHVLAKFIKAVNKKTVFNALQKEIIVDSKIKTNGKDTTYFYFSSPIGEKIATKTTAHASCIQLLAN